MSDKKNENASKEGENFKFKEVQGKNIEEIKSEQSQPLRVRDFIIMLLIIAIPVVNIIALLWWSTSRGVNVNKRNFGRASLIIAIVSVILVVFIPTLLQGIGLFSGGSAPEMPSEWAREEVAIANSYDIIPESLNKEYGKDITRKEMAQLAVMLYEKVKGETTVVEESNPYNDTNNTYVLKAAALGLVSSSPGQTIDFRPNDNVTRSDMSIIMLHTVRAIDQDFEIDTQKHSEFTDREQIQDWAEDAVHFAFNHGIISAHEARIAPLMNLNREEAIICSKRIYEQVK